MLDTIDLSSALSKQAFKPIRREMLRRIFELSEMVYERKRPVIIVFEGWDAAGKGTTIRALTQQLDARGYKVLATQAARTHEKQKPWLWRFWMNIPRYGQIAIFDRSWYGRVLVERVEGLTPLPEWIAAYEEINQFERTLADDGTVFIKFWLHISREEQLRRFIELSQEPDTAWQVAAEDWEHHRKYEEYLAAVRDMLASTNTAYAPWTVVPSTDREFRIFMVLRTIVERLEGALGLEATQWSEAEFIERGAGRASKQAKKAKGKQGKAQADESAETPAAAMDDANDQGSKKVKVKKATKPGKSAKKDKKKAKKNKAHELAVTDGDRSGANDGANDDANDGANDGDNGLTAADQIEELELHEQVVTDETFPPPAPGKKSGRPRKKAPALAE